MRIKSIVLVGYKRMLLNDIRSFTLRPTQRIQLILGTNGSGKSSLLSELSPLPALSANYASEGSKTIEINHRGNNYVLTSVFSAGKQRHSCMKNGEELNVGNTLSVQKDLVKHEFGVTQEIHELASGQKRFSFMDPRERREWFTRLCDTNYDYALKLYTKMRETHRDTVGALKLAQKRLVVETSKVISAEEVERIQLEVTRLHDDLNLIYNSKMDSTLSVRDVEDSQKAIAQEISSLFDRFKRNRESLRGYAIWSPEELLNEINLNKQELAVVDSRIEVLTQEHDELTQVRKSYAESGENDIQELKKRRQGLQERVKASIASCKLGLDVKDPVIAKSALTSIYEFLVSVLQKLPENPDKKFSSVNLAIARDMLAELSAQKVKFEQRVVQLLSQKEHLFHQQSAEPTQCPKCKHKWHIGYSESEAQRVADSLEAGAKKIDEVAIEIQVQDKLVQENSEYGELYREVMRSCKATPQLNAFWEMLMEKEIFSKTPRYAITQLDILGQDLDATIVAREANAEIVEIDDHISLAEKNTSVDIGNVTGRLAAVESDLGLLTQKKHDLILKIDVTTTGRKRMVELEATWERVHTLIQSFDKGITTHLQALRSEMLGDCLRQTQLELAQKQNVLSELTAQQAVIADLNANIAVLVEEEEALKAIVGALSPTDGIIADGLLGFIKSFVKQMNIVIKRTWAYRMEVQDCGAGENGETELDYKFGLLVGTADNVVPDVGKTSTGQREIIDLAFKIVSMKYLGLGDGPLILDELGAALDEGHKAAVHGVVKALIEQMSFSQLWMVSHDFGQYGALSNAEICVLSPLNISVPEVYNTHVEIL
jgi:DNA repair exonuclease SbcCD ATPase subunit